MHRILRVLFASAAIAAPAVMPSTAMRSTAAAAPAATDPADGALALPDGVELDLLFLRGQEINRRAALRVTNASGSSLHVTSAQLRSPFFETVDEAAVNVVIPAGRVLDVFVDYGPAVCPAAARPSLMALTVSVDGGAPESGTIAVDDHAAAVRSGRECDQRYVTERVTVSFADEFTVDGDVAHATLEVERVDGDDAVVVHHVRGTVTMGIAPEPAGPPVAELAPATSSAAIPVSIWAARCDEHAVIESKRNYHFRAWVTVGDVAEQLLIVQVPESTDLWRALEQLMHVCATGAA